MRIKISRSHALPGIIMFIFLFTLITSAVMADNYQPLPGILAPEDVDFGGKTVTIVSGGLPDAERVLAAEKLFSVKIERMGLDSIEQLMSRIMAGDSSLDIIKMPQRQGYFNLVKAGMLLPVSDILPAEHFEALSVADRYTIEKLRFQGKYYGFGTHHGVHNSAIWLMGYNKDVLKKYNQPDPYELWLNGEWTYDALEQIIQAVTLDTDGDGVIDQYGMTDIGGSAAFYRFAPSNGVELARIENGKYIFDYDSEAAIEVLNRVYHWRMELGVMGGNLADGTAVFNLDHLGGMRHPKAQGINYGIVSLPKGPHADRYYYPVFEYWMNMLPINAEYPEGLLALTCFLYREEDTQEDLEFRINEYMTSREHENLYLTGIETWQGEGDMFQGKISDLWAIAKPGVEDVLNGLKGAAAAMDEIRPLAQAFLDDLFAQ